MRSILLLIATAALALSQNTPAKSEDQIRSARREIDDAFQRYDTKQLTAFVTLDCHFTAPTIHTDGADALKNALTSLFTKRPDVTLKHQANRIMVNEGWDVASESGEWIERWTSKDGVTELRGSYLTVWKPEAGQWREYNETIVPESCSGSSYCQQK